MSIKIIHSDYSSVDLVPSYASALQRYFIKRMHPRKIIFDTIGATWSIYFLYQNNWQLALLTEIIFVVAGLFATRNVDLDNLAQTTWGKLGLLHTNPINLFLNVIGIVPLIVGIWLHSTELVLVASSISEEYRRIGVCV